MTPLLAAPAAVLELGPPWLDPQHLITAFGGWALLGVCLVVFAETGLLLGFFLPGDTLLFSMGLLAATGALGTPVWLVVLGLAVAATAGGMSGYLIGRRAGPVLLERTSFVSDDQLARTHAFFERHGPVTIVVARFVPVVRTLAPVVAGAARMPLRRYAPGNAAGALLWAAALVLGGYWLGQIPGVSDFALRYLDTIILGVVVVTVLVTAVRLLRDRRARRTAGGTTTGGGTGTTAGSATGTPTGTSMGTSTGTAAASPAGAAAGTTGEAPATAVAGGSADAPATGAPGAGPGRTPTTPSGAPASRAGRDATTMARTGPSSPAAGDAPRSAAGPRHRTCEETP